MRRSVNASGQWTPNAKTPWAAYDDPFVASSGDVRLRDGRLWCCAAATQEGSTRACAFAEEFGLPCRHVLAVQQLLARGDDLPLFSDTDVPVKYHLEFYSGRADSSALPRRHGDMALGVAPNSDVFPEPVQRHLPLHSSTTQEQAAASEAVAEAAAAAASATPAGDGVSSDVLHGDDLSWHDDTSASEQAAGGDVSVSADLEASLNAWISGTTEGVPPDLVADWEAEARRVLHGVLHGVANARNYVGAVQAQLERLLHLVGRVARDALDKQLEWDLVEVLAKTAQRELPTGELTYHAIMDFAESALRQWVVRQALCGSDLTAQAAQLEGVLTATHDAIRVVRMVESRRAESHSKNCS